MVPVRSLYIHVPFCFHKCHYCDFYSLVDTRDRQEPFLGRLIRELRALAPLTRGEPLRTIFVGGGTPTLLRTDLWRRLLGVLGETFDLGLIRAGAGEFTVECNPETATAELFDVLRAGGVGRLSMGAQSFDPKHLKTLERWHDPASVDRAIGLARAAGIERLSVDLIFAIPGQSMAEWEADLGRAIGLGVTHLSCYALTYEPNTAMTARLRRGDFAPCDEDLEADMHERTLERCRAAGLDRYEVSNYAAAGEECRHNLAYWRQEPWLAAGPSASAHLLDPSGGSWRWKNAPRLDDYLQSDDDGFAPAVDVEPPDPARLAGERIMAGLRLREGIDLGAVAAEHDRKGRGGGGQTLATLLGEARRHVERGHAELHGSRIVLTDSGFLFADGIARDFLGLVR
ncbi:MAG: radical SAM family heme chaperone HemW [Phycisphaerales bacterium]|nr:radical SAM family heme chaperone HemW [Phycisphaerales bacterium]